MGVQAERSSSEVSQTGTSGVLAPCRKCALALRKLACKDRSDSLHRQGLGIGGTMGAGLRRAAAVCLAGAVFLGVDLATASDAIGQIEALEKKIDALIGVINQQQKTIDTLQQQRGSAPEAASDVGSDPAQRVGAPGAFDGQGLVSGLPMSACPLKLDASRRLPDACQGLPYATVSVSLQARLGSEVAVGEEALTPFLKVQDGGVAGVRWSGRLAIARPGAHDFQLALGYAGKEYAGQMTCRSALRLAGQGVVKVFAEFASDQTNPVAEEQANHSFEPGHHNLEVFLFCFAAFDRLRTVVGNPDMTRFLEGVSVTLTFAELGDTALKPVPASRIGIAS